MGKPTTNPPTWATDAAADVATPPVQQRAIGWVAEDIPPAGWVNYLYKWWSSWVDYLKGALPGFTTLHDAFAGLTAGDAAVVYESDRANRVGTEHSDGGIAGTAVLACCATGTDVIYAENAANPKLVARSDLDTVVRTFTKTNAGTVQKLVTDGLRVYAAYGNYVEAFTISTGASVWVYDHGATVWDLAVWDGRLFLGGVSGTGAKEARSLNAETGAAQWSYNHNATIFSVTATHDRVIIGGAASGHASGAHLRALQYSTGNDAANEGGTAADTTGVAWDRVLANAVSANSLAADARGIWLVDDTANTVIRIDTAMGTTVQTGTLSAVNASHGIAVDQDYVLLAADDYVWALDKATLATSWRFYFSGANGRCVDSDGCAVYAGFSNVGGDQGLKRIYRGNRPHVFRRITIGGAGAERYQVNPRAIVPE